MAGEELRAEKLLATDPDAALRLLLEVWRRDFDPTVGRLIEDLGANVAEPIEGLPLKKGERAAELAKRVPKASHRDRTGLLIAFEDFAREAPGGMVWPSVEAWAEAKPDPRVARMALRVLTAMAHNLTAKLWRRLVNCIEVHGDLGVVEDARPYEALLKTKGSGWGFSLERFSNVLKKLTKARQCKLPSDAEVIARLRARVGTRSAAAPAKAEDASEMLDAIAAQPDDDGPRLVYADWLVERRLPAGEFIVLQVARANGKVSAEARAREADLLATHRTTLLGPFEKVMMKSGLKFERGFLAAGKATDKIPANPFTRLLRRVEFGYFGFAKGAQFDSLLEAVGPATPLRDELPPLAPRLTSWDVSADFWKQLLASIAKIPLESLTLRRIKDVSLSTILPELYAAAPRLNALELFVTSGVVPRLILKDSLRSIAIHTGPLDVSLKREKSGWVGDIEVGYFAHPAETAQELTEVLSAFPDRGLASAKLTFRDAREGSARFEATMQAVRRVAAELVR